jgi:biotin carboxyl carrier protein
MPGLVLNVLVQAGQEVAKGDALLILEAMKMENVIKASGDGKVKSVKVKQGEAVDKGLLLVEME